MIVSGLGYVKFNTVLGRGLLGELAGFVHRPYVVVTMEDLWPKFAHHFEEHLAAAYFVKTGEYDQLAADLDALPAHAAVIGVGGGQAVDVAKLVAWRHHVPLFQVPTVLSVNAVFGHRAAVRYDGNVKYIGWAVPEAVYVDIDAIQGAPKAINRASVGDLWCIHTAHHDWRLARDRGTLEAKWPYDEPALAEAKQVLQLVKDHVDDIREVNDTGVRVLAEALQWSGAAFHNYGWNPRYVEGAEHFLFYTLEAMTGKAFIHGQIVGLGIAVISDLQDNEADEMLGLLHRAGVDIRPEAMDVTWEEVAAAMREMRRYVHQQGLWYSVAHEAEITDNFIERTHDRVYGTYGPWTGKPYSPE